MKKYIKKYLTISIECLLVFFSGFLIYHHETIQEKISPGQFWERKVSKLQNDVVLGQKQIAALELSVQKEKTSLSSQNDHTPEKFKENQKYILHEMEKDLYFTKQMLLNNQHKLELALTKVTHD